MKPQVPKQGTGGASRRSEIVPRDLERDLVDDDIIDRTARAHQTPRRYEEPLEDAAMPSSRSSLNTKI